MPKVNRLQDMVALHEHRNALGLKKNVQPIREHSFLNANRSEAKSVSVFQDDFPIFDALYELE